jgi:hypothetical protein
MKEKDVLLIPPHYRKQYFLHHFHCILIKLSFISNTFLLRNRINILIFSRIFNFHKYLVGKWLWEFMRSSYVNFQTNISSSSFSCTIINWLRCCIHASHLVTSRIRRNTTFKETLERIECIKTFLRTIKFYFPGLCTN